MFYEVKNLKAEVVGDYFNVDFEIHLPPAIEKVKMPTNITKEQNMEHQKDYSLLRPFDLEAAKRGDLITDNYMTFKGKAVWKYAAGPDSNGDIIVTKLSDGMFADKAREECFRMAPLTWVEGKPVYRGDVLYRTELRKTATADSAFTDADGDTYLSFKEGGNAWICGPYNTACKLTWKKPKTKREGWVNMVAVRFDSKEDAEKYKQPGQVTAYAQWEE